MATKLYVGTMHERPSTIPMNKLLQGWDSAWRVTTTKSMGLCVWNPDTQIHFGTDDEGYVTIPDLYLTPQAIPDIFKPPAN